MNPLFSAMFIDWLSIYQDFDFELPLISDRHFIAVETSTGEPLGIKQDNLKHEGSFCTSINIRISGNRIYISGNPSRVNRLDNLFGLTSVEHCVDVYNAILRKYGLPEFTKCTKRIHMSGKHDHKVKVSSDGAVITEIHLTSNLTVGQGNVLDYLKGISTLPYQLMVPNLRPNGRTVEWLTKKGRASTLMYPGAYDKAFEIMENSLVKIKNKFGEESKEFKYLQDVVNYCIKHGVVRFEQKLKSAFLRKHDIQFYGLCSFDSFGFLKNTHRDFLNLTQKLMVEAMDLETITEKLISQAVCSNTKSANATALYATLWMHGKKFDLTKSQTKIHRARLRQIGIDIALECDITKHSLVTVKASRTVELGVLPIPNWYQRAANSVQLRAVA